MNLKLVAAALAGALVGFLVGNFAGFGPGTAPPPLPSAPVQAAAPRQTQQVAALRDHNDRLQAELAKLNADLAKLTEANAALVAERAARPTPPPVGIASRGPTLGLARYEVQQGALNNLRQIDAARKYYLTNKGRVAGSIHELVGRGSLIKTVRTIDGEDYSNLPMNPAEPMTVTTPDGIAVTFDPTGKTTTVPEVPPEVARVGELAQKIQPTVVQATNAYRSANGKNPPNEQALIPYFATPQEGADFTEFLEAKKAAGL